MIYSYIPSFYSLAEIEQLLTQYRLENPIVAVSFDEFLSQINPTADQVVVHSATVFSSLIDLLSATQKVHLSSLSEPWLSETTPYLASLYNLATEIHIARTHRGLARARANGTKLGRRFNP